MKNLCLFALLLLALYSCKKKSEVENIVLPVFSGITYRDDTGQNFAWNDASDWNFKDKWSEQEENLFISLNTNKNCPLPVGKDTLFMVCFPNPSTHSALALVFKDSSAVFEYIIVNQLFEKLDHQDSITVRDTELNMEKIRQGLTATDTIIRMYYRIITNDNCEYRGHGDLLLK